MRRFVFTALSAILVSATIGFLSPAAQLATASKAAVGAIQAIANTRVSGSAERPPPARMPVAGSIRATRSHTNGGASSAGRFSSANLVDDA